MGPFKIDVTQFSTFVSFSWTPLNNKVDLKFSNLHKRLDFILMCGSKARVYLLYFCKGGRAFWVVSLCFLRTSYLKGEQNLHVVDHRKQ